MNIHTGDLYSDKDHNSLMLVLHLICKYPDPYAMVYCNVFTNFMSIENMFLYEDDVFITGVVE